VEPRLLGWRHSGALSQAWTSAEGSLPLGWQLRGLCRCEDLWVGLADPTLNFGPASVRHLHHSNRPR